MRKGSVLLAIVASMGMLGTAAPARADFEVQFSFGGATITYDATTNTTSTSGGASTSGATFSNTPSGQITIDNLVVSPTGTTGGFTMAVTIATSNSPGGAVASLTIESL